MSFTMNKPLLMIPGPMDPPDEVLRRCGMPVFPHYEGDFPAFYHQLVDKMKTIFGLKDGDVFIPNGSGTIAVNMMLASLVTPNDRVLIINNGSFGAYAEKNCVSLGVPYTFVDGTWGTVIDYDKVRDAMKKQRHQFLYVTHNESSTAMVNPLKPLGDIAREFDALMIVDAVSGVGGVVIDMDDVGADVVAGATQKCLELPPGLAPVAVGRRAWNYMEKMKDRKVPFILDFVAWKKAQVNQYKDHPQPVTGATTMLYALDWTTDQILAEGLYNRQERFRAAGADIKKGFAELGFKSGPDPLYASPVVSEFICPEGILGNDVRDFYLKKHNTMVGYGMRTNKDGQKISFRIAHFGRAAEPERIAHMIKLTKLYMEEHAK